jgi:hypothetical protein
MDPLFWILAGVVALCVVGIIIIWRLEVKAERRAADTRRVEAEVSARLKFFDPRAAIEEVDTRPVPATTPQPLAQPKPGVRPQPVAQPKPVTRPQPVAQEAPTLWEMLPPVEQSQPMAHKQEQPVAQEAEAAPLQEAPAFALPEQPEAVLPPLAQPVEDSALSTPQSDWVGQPAWAESAPPQPEPEPEPALASGLLAAEGQPDLAVVNTDYLSPPEDAPVSPEFARARASELGRERRYLEQAIEEQKDHLAHLLHIQASLGAQETAPIRQLQQELAEQRRRLEDLIAQEEYYRQAAAPSLEQLAQDYKNAAAPHTPRAFGVRRHSLASFELPRKNPPAPPTQAPTDSSS